MSYQKPHDPMAKIVIAIASVVLLTTVFVLVSNLYTTIERNSSVVTIVASTSSSPTPEIAPKVDINSSLTPEITPDSETADTKENTDTEDSNASMAKAGSVASAINDNLRRIGSADASAKSTSSASRSGDEIFNTVCTACHTSGVLEAPKFGDKAAWESRMVNGFDALLTSAINGKGNMPAKGGDASLSDDEVKAAIIHMLEKVGINAGVSAVPAAIEEESTTPAATEEPSAAAVPTPVEVVTAPADNSAAAPETITEETLSAARIPTTPETAALVAPTAETKTVEPQAAPTAPVKDSAPTAPSQDPKPVATEVAVPPAAIPAVDTGEGKKLYKTVCFTCHDAGVAGAPIMGNKEQWAARIAQGQEAMYHTALNGKGAMPAKGGNPALDDNIVKAAVDYMVSHSK